jgi:Spy/CpxP family protein refolding chaperone
MTTTRKILTSLAAAGLAAATTLAYADPPGGWGGGYRGPGMMYQGGGYGPGMMAYGGPHGGYGPGAAAGVPCDGFGPGAAAGVGPVVRMEQRLSHLKNELKITPEQESAWNAYAENAKTQASTMEAFRAQPPAAAQTPAERIEQRAERMNLRSKQITAMSAAVKDLYAVLTPEQKAVADLHFGGRRLSQAGPRGYAR